MSSIWWVNIILALFVIFFARKNPRSTLMWVMVLTFIPIIGFMFYLLLGQDYTKRKMFKLKEEEDQFIRDITGLQVENITGGKFWYRNSRSAEYDNLIQMNLRLDESFYTQDNYVQLFFWGEDKFNLLLEEINKAVRSIDIQYYIFKYDVIGRKIIRALEQKAKEGVKVRLLFDGVGGRQLRKDYFKKLAHYGGEYAIFFPSIIPAINFRNNYRNHRKIVVIDDHIGFLGGFNIGDEYLGNSRRFGPWRDTHMMIRGTGVLGLKFRFLKDWYYASGKDLESDEGIQPNSRIKGDIALQIVTSGPDTKFDNIKNTMFRMINDAKECIFIQTPYFIPDDAVMDALKTAIISGVQVYIMIPDRADHLFVYPANRSYLGELLELGAKGYEYNKGFLHSKVLVVDDYLSTIGSANMDIRSFSLNFEANAVIYDEEINQQLKNQFAVDLVDSTEITLEAYRDRSRYMKIKESISRLLSPIL